MNIVHTVTLRKPARRNLNEETIQGNITSLVANTSTKTLRNMGWTVDANDPAWDRELPRESDGDAKFVFVMHLTITFAHASRDHTEHEFASIVHTIATRSVQPRFGLWTVDAIDGQPYIPPKDGEFQTSVSAEQIGYAEIDIPADWDDFFSHLYGLDSHIMRVKKAIQAAIDSGFVNRFNVVLVGPPGCGKSDIADSVGRALSANHAPGEEPVWRLDATATTAAGTIKELGERVLLPRVALFEEAEKASEKVTEPFLGILDQRGEVRKTTARAKIQRDARFLVISTVNDYETFKKMNAGALASRHTVKVFFNRPSRETLTLILTREVQKINGDPGWIIPTLDYCEAHGINDPREVISHCLVGAESWLDGTYAKMLADTAQSE